MATKKEKRIIEVKKANTKDPMLLEAWNSAKEEYYNKCIKMC